MNREVLRNPTIARVCVGVALVLAGLAVYYGPTSQTGLICLTGAAIIALSLRWRLIVEPDGLTVVGLVTKRYRWDEIGDINSTWSCGIHPVMSLTLADGTEKHVWGASAGRGGLGADWVHDTVARLRLRWKEELTYGPIAE